MSFIGLLDGSFMDSVVLRAAEHERMVEAYSALNQKLQHSLADQNYSQRQIQELKVYCFFC